MYVFENVCTLYDGKYKKIKICANEANYIQVYTCMNNPSNNVLTLNIQELSPLFYNVYVPPGGV